MNTKVFTYIPSRSESDPDLKYRNAKDVFGKLIAEHYTTIHFMDADGLRVVYARESIPGEWPTLGTTCTRVNVMLKHGVSYKEATDMINATRQSRPERVSAQWSLTIADRDTLCLKLDNDTESLAMIHRDGKVTATFSPKGLYSTIVKAAATIAEKFILGNDSDCLKAYVDDSIVASVCDGKYRVTLSPNATASDAVPELARVMRLSNADPSEYGALGGAIAMDHQSRVQFVNWRMA